MARAARQVSGARRKLARWRGVSIRKALRRKAPLRRLSLLGDKAPTLFRKVTFRESLTSILLAIPSAATTMLTYYGVSGPLEEVGGTFVQKAQALGFAITIGVYAWLTWSYLFGLTYRLSGRQLRNALIAGGVMVSAIAAIDAPFNMLALAGDRATQMSLVDVTGRYEEQRSSASRSAAVAQRLLPALKVQAARFEALRAGEEVFGTYSGRSGPGKVSETFGQLAVQLSALVRELEAGLARSASLREGLTASFRELKRQAYRPGPIRPRMEAVSVIADDLDALLEDLHQYDFTPSLDATLASLETSLLRPSGGGSAFADVQAGEINAIAGMAQPVAATLRAALASLQAGSGDEAAVRRPQDPMTAIRIYWWPLFPQWCAALFIDLAPAALLLILIAGYREVELSEETRKAARRRPASPAPNRETAT